MSLPEEETFRRRHFLLLFSFCIVRQIFLSGILLHRAAVKHLGRQEGQEYNGVQYEGKQHICPAYGLAADLCRSANCHGQVVVYKVEYYRHPDVPCAHIGKGKEHPQSDAGDLVGRNALKGIARAVEEQVQRQVPQPPYHAKKYGATDEAKALLQQRLEIVAPAVLLTEESGKAEEEIGYQHRHEYVGRRGLPVGQILAQLAAEGHGYKAASQIQSHEQQHQQQGAAGLSLGPAQSVGSPAFFFLGKKEYPGEHRPGNDHIGLYGDPVHIRADKHSVTARRRQRRKGNKKQEETPGHGLRLLSTVQARSMMGNQAGQHHPRRRIEHLGVGEGIGVQAKSVGKAQRQAGNKRKAKGYYDKYHKLPLFKGHKIFFCFHQDHLLIKPAVIGGGIFSKLPHCLSRRGR